MSGALTANHRLDHAGPCTPTEIDCSVYSLKPAMPRNVTAWIDSTYYVISTHKTASVRNKCSIKLHASASAELARYELEIINAASQHYARRCGLLYPHFSAHMSIVAKTVTHLSYYCWALVLCYCCTILILFLAPATVILHGVLNLCSWQINDGRA